MIRRIELKNFMSHSHTVIEPANGLTVLIGDNNCGKSAVVAALQIVCQNASGSYMVRHGEKECEVTLETEEPSGERNQLTWKKTKGKVSYVVNGREVDRLKRGVPDDLHKLLRLPQVETSRDMFDVHIGEQKQPIFLLADKASDRAAFFASSSDTCKLIEMQELHRTRTKESRRIRKQKAVDRIQIEKRLDNFVGLQEIESLLDQLGLEFGSIQKMELHCDSIAKFATSAQRFSSEIKRLEKRTSILSWLTKPPEVQDAKSVRSMIARMTMTSAEIRNQAQSLAVFETLKPPPAVGETTVLRALTGKISRTRQLVRLETKKLSATQDLSPVPTMSDCVALKKLDGEMREAQGKVDHYQAIRRSLVELELPPTSKEFESTGKLVKLIDHLNRARLEFASFEKQLLEVNREWEATEKQLREKFEEFESCPTCGVKIDVDYSLTRSKTNSEIVKQPKMNRRIKKGDAAISETAWKDKE